MPFRKTKLWGRVKPPVGSVIKWGDPINTGLAARYLLNEGGGAYAVNLVKPITSVVLDSTIARHPPAPGLFGMGLTVTGTCINNFRQAITLTADLTIAAWVKTSDNTTAAMWLGGGGGGGNMKIGYSAGNVFARVVSGGTGGGGTAPSVNVWHFVVITRNKALVVRQSIDGGPFILINGGAPEAGNCVIDTLGSQNGGGQNWLGTIDNIAIWSRALTLTELQRLYGEPFAGIESPRRRIVSSIAAGGTLYTQTITGTITTVGTLIKGTLKNLTGSLSASGTLNKLVNFALHTAGSITATGNLVKLTSKVVSGTITTVGNVFKSTSRLLTRSITITGVLSTAFYTYTSITGSITAAGSVIGDWIDGAVVAASGVCKPFLRRFMGRR